MWPMGCSPPGSSAHRISQARILEWSSLIPCRGRARWRWMPHFSRLRSPLFHGEQILSTPARQRQPPRALQAKAAHALHKPNRGLQRASTSLPRAKTPLEREFCPLMGSRDAQEMWSWTERLEEDSDLLTIWATQAASLAAMW